MRPAIAGALLLAALPSLVAGDPAAAKPTNIFVAGYDGFVRTVQLTGEGSSSKLTLINQTDGCKTNPSWLTIDFPNHRLWCLDEGFVAGFGTLNQFDIEDSGVLKPVQHRNVSASPVHSKLYNGGKNIVLAQFGNADATGIRGGITIHTIDDKGTLTEAVNHTFDTLPAPGPRPGQAVPRAHGVYPDPKDKNIVVLDYGADQIRTFNIAPDGTGSLNVGSVVQLPPGTGPRHAAFFSHTPTSQLYLLVLSEFLNTITTFNVNYDANDAIVLTGPSRVIDTFGGTADATKLENAKAAEIRVSYDNQFVIVSNRNDTSFPESDSLATFRVNPDGSLAFVQLAAAGGLFPRAFQVNLKGDRVLVAAQTDSKITVLDRNPHTGIIGNVLVELAINTTVDGVVAGLPAAIWDE
jgi:6-phosphogluconolactonase (cycloisomerase 2 family)